MSKSLAFANLCARDMHVCVCIISDEIDNDPMAGAEKLLGRYGDVLNGSDFKMKDIVNMYVGEMITSMHKAPLVTGGKLWWNYFFLGVDSFERP